MKYFKKLESDNIYLSPMSIEDAEQYCKWLNDFKVTDKLGNSTRMATLQNEKAWLESSTSKNEYQFAIIRKQEDILIGNCGFNDIDILRQVGEVGIFIGEESERSKGYGTEALKLLLDYGFNYLNLNNIMLTVFSFNEGAMACYKKVGFKEFGRRKEAYYLKGERHDVVYMDIIRKEYFECIK